MARIHSPLVLAACLVACGGDPPDGEPVLVSTSVDASGGSGGTGDSGDASTGGSAGSTSSGAADEASGSDESGPPPGDSSGEPPSGDPCEGADILCDGFEGAALDPQWAFVGNPANMPTIDASHAYSGQGSLHFPMTDTQGAFVYPSAGLPPPGDRVYVRAYVSFERDMSQMGGHVSYIVGADQPANGAELRLGASQNFGSGQMMVDVNLLGAGPEYTQFSNGDVTGGAPSGAAGVTLAADAWYCMEALFDGQGDEFRLWIDGVEVMQMHVTDWQQGVTGWSPTYAVVKIGGQNYSGSLGAIWFDDVAMGTQPLGCP